MITGLVRSIWDKKGGYFIPVLLVWVACLPNWQTPDVGTFVARLAIHLVAFVAGTWLLVRFFHKKWPAENASEQQSWLLLSALPVIFIPSAANHYPIYLLIFFILYGSILFLTSGKKIRTVRGDVPLWIQAAVPVLCILFVVLLVKIAWVGDDAFITFRTIDNFLHGYGLRWNITERVQSYTHPLWMFLLAFFVFFTEDIYYTAIFLSMALSLVSLFLLMRHSGLYSLQGITALAVCMSSKAFMDYTSSGLENPLSYLLAGLFLWIWYRPSHPNRLFWLVLIGSLSAVNRHDTVILFVPCMLYEFFRPPFRRERIGAVLAGSTPLLAWTAFSLIYYGFPFPNTAYAKLNTGIAAHDFFVQGTHYYVNSISFDPITLGAIAGVLVLVTLSKREAHLVPMAGVLLYLLYIVKIGGDFMSGRFFSVPFYVSVFVFARLDLKAVYRYSALGLAAILTLLNTHAPLRMLGTEGLQTLTGTGITDERACYADYMALTNHTRSNDEFFQHAWIRQGKDNARNPQADTVSVLSAIGIIGYYSGPRFYWIDFLSDPLLARIPLGKTQKWRTGHYYRHLPPGYLKSREENANYIEAPGLALYFEKMKIVTESPVWSKERFIEIFRFNTGYYDHLLPSPEETDHWAR